MPKKQQTDFWTWIGWNRQPNFEDQPKWLGGLIGFGLLCIALCIAIAALALIGWFLTTLLAPVDPAQAPEAIRNLGLAAAAVIGLPFLVWRSIVAQRQADTAEQGLITDRINKAVEGLGAVREVKEGEDTTTKPNLEVRLGALYSLQRIAEDSPRDRGQILNMLCAYIRENAPAPAPIFSGEERPEELDAKLRGQKRSKSIAKTDIQTAVDVIGAILKASEQASDTPDFSRNLGNSDLGGVRFDDITFVDWEFGHSHFDDARFSECTFKRCYFNNTQWIHASLWKSTIDASVYVGATFVECNVWQCSFINSTQSSLLIQTPKMVTCEIQGGNFSSDYLRNGSFYKGVLLATEFDANIIENVDLRSAVLEDTIFHQPVLLSGCKFNSSTKFPRSGLTGFGFDKCDLSKTNLTANDLRQAFVDASVTLSDSQREHINR